MESPYSIYLRFAQYYLQKLRATEVVFRTGQVDAIVEALTLLDADLAQIRQAQACLSSYAIEDIELTQVCLLYTAIDNRLLTLRFSNDERIAWYSTALNAARQAKDEAAVRLCLYGVATGYVGSGRYDLSVPYLQELLTLAQSTQAKRDEAKAWLELGIIAYHRGSQSEAQDALETAITLLNETGDRSDALGVSLLSLAAVYSAQGQHELSLKSLQPAIVLFRQNVDPYHLCTALSNFGSEYHALGNYSEALAALEEGLVLAKRLGNDDTLGYLLANLGLVMLSMGQQNRAQRYLEESIAILRTIGNLHAVIAISGFLFHASMNIDNLEPSRNQLCDLISQAHKLKMVGNVLALLTAFAKWYLLAGQPVRCIELLNFVTPRPELDSEWLPFIARISEGVAIAYPGLTVTTLSDQSLNQIIAEVLLIHGGS